MVFNPGPFERLNSFGVLIFLRITSLYISSGAPNNITKINENQFHLCKTDACNLVFRLNGFKAKELKKKDEQADSFYSFNNRLVKVLLSPLLTEVSRATTEYNRVHSPRNQSRYVHLISKYTNNMNTVK